MFKVNKVEFLGHEVTTQGARALSSHVDALQRHPMLTVLSSSRHLGVGQLLTPVHPGCRRVFEAPHRLSAWRQDRQGSS